MVGEVASPHFSRIQRTKRSPNESKCMEPWALSCDGLLAFTSVQVRSGMVSIVHL